MGKLTPDEEAKIQFVKDLLQRALDEWELRWDEYLFEGKPLPKYESDYDPEEWEILPGDRYSGFPTRRKKSDVS